MLFLALIFLIWVVWRQEEINKTHMAKLSTLGGTLATVLSTLEKVVVEVQALKDSLGDVEIPADAQESLDKLTALAKTLDDLNPDAPTP